MTLDHNFWMQLAAKVALRSLDPSTKVGTVIVKPNGYMVAAGFNHFAKGIAVTPERLADRNLKYPRTIHAEMDAILHAAEKVDGCNLYTTVFPCKECAKHIIDAGIVEVYSVLPDDMERWRESFELANTLFRDAGVKVQVYPHGVPSDE